MRTEQIARMKLRGCLLSCVRRTSTAASSVTSSTHAPIQETETAKPFSEMPGPSGIQDLPYVGMALQFKPFTKYDMTQLPEVFANLRDQYGDIYKLRMGKHHVVSICHPQHGEAVFRTPSIENKRDALAIGETYYRRKNINARALSQLNGPLWKSTKEVFHEKLMKLRTYSYITPTVDKVANEFIEHLSRQSKLDDAFLEFEKYSTDSIGMMTLNKRLGCIEDKPEIDFPAVSKSILEAVQQTFFMPLHSYKYFRTKLYMDFEKHYTVILDFVKKETKKQLEQLENLAKAGKLEEHLDTNYSVLCDILLDGRLNSAQISSMIADFYTGGIDASASILTSVLANLASYPDMQEKIYQEIVKVMGDDKELTKEHLDKMPYLKACVKESYRLLYPGFLGTIRYMECDANIGGYIIPKDTKVIIHNGLMCVDKRFFPSTLEFLPERWLRDNDYGILHPFILKPFGFGPRICAGQRIAEMQVHVCLMRIIQNFKVSMPQHRSNVKWTRRIFNVPVQPLAMTFVPRK